jgi:hypothetical protein
MGAFELLDELLALLERLERNLLPLELVSKSLDLFFFFFFLDDRFLSFFLLFAEWSRLEPLLRAISFNSFTTSDRLCMLKASLGEPPLLGPKPPATAGLATAIPPPPATA